MRSSLNITLSVWRALLLREALTRITGGRAPWFWLLAEPVAHIAFLTSLLTVIGHRVIGGINAVVWIVSGLLAFFFFRRTLSQGVSSIASNAALFTYRQVRPVDTVLVRVFLEGTLMVLISIIVFAGLSILGVSAFPDDPLLVLLAIGGLWLLGLGVALIYSVSIELIPETNFVLTFLMMPLYIASGVILPIASIPMPYRGWLLVNPIVHGLEATRLGFSSYYHVVPEFDLGYLYLCGLVTVFLGFALHMRFAQRLIAK